MADLATLQTRLAEAESARHALMTGGQVREVWRDGRRVIYSQADSSQLDRYIEELKGEIAALTAETPSGVAYNRRPMRAMFR